MGSNLDSIICHIYVLVATYDFQVLSIILYICGTYYFHSLLSSDGMYVCVYILGGGYYLELCKALCVVTCISWGILVGVCGSDMNDIRIRIRMYMYMYIRIYVLRERMGLFEGEDRQPRSAQLLTPLLY